MNEPLFSLVFGVKSKCLATEERIRGRIGLTQAEFHALIALEPRAELTGAVLAERMGLSVSRGSRVLGRLVESGYVLTRPNPDDRREVIIAMSARGRKIKRTIEDELIACERRALARLSKSQVQQIKESLAMLRQAL